MGVALLGYLKQYLAARTFGWKPVAAGCTATPSGWRNEDALALQAAASQPLDYQQVNPIALPPAIAPHIAAQAAGVELSVRVLEQLWQRLPQQQADWVLVEGAGGWELPLNEHECLPHWVLRAELPVLLVVGLRLGCLNHALLTARRIADQGGRLVGWVANELQAEPMPWQAENIATLDQHLAAPRLGSLGYGDRELTFTAAGQAWLQSATP